MKVILVCFVAIALLAYQSEAEATGCFPECRSGFVCTPERECVSACNPVCDDGQSCSDDGQCYGQADNTNKPAPNSSRPSSNDSGQRVNDTAGERSVHLQAGFILQIIDTEDVPAFSAFGLQLSATIYPTAHPLFLRPRVVVVLGDENFYEPSLDLGYEIRVPGQKMNFSAPAALVLGAWPQVVDIAGGSVVDAVGPYLGVSVTPTLEVGRFSIALHLERGFQLVKEPNIRVASAGFLIGGIL